MKTLIYVYVLAIVTIAGCARSFDEASTKSLPKDSAEIISLLDVYCYPIGTEGGSLRVDLDNKLMCHNAGMPRADFCTGGNARSAKIAFINPNGVRPDNQGNVFKFTTVSANDPVTNKVTTLRVFQNSFTTSNGHNVHHAEIEGALVLNDPKYAVTRDPGSPPVSREYACYRYNRP